MNTAVLLPPSLLGALSLLCAVFCDHPSSDVTLIMDQGDDSNNTLYYEQGNFSERNKSSVYGFTYDIVPKDSSVLYNNNFTGYVFPFETLYNSFIFFAVEKNETYFIKDVSNHTKFYLSSQWLTSFVPSVYTVVFIVALPLNLMAILMFLLKIKIKTTAVVYMLNLAIADVLFVALLPFNIVYRFRGNNWQIGEGMCRFATAAFYCNMYCSILLMTSMSVDRYMGLVFPMQARTWRTKKRAWLVCVAIWLVSITSTVPLLLTSQTLNIDSLGITTCHDVLELADQQNFYMYYFTAFSSIFFFFPLIVTIFCYTEILRSLSKNAENIENSSKKTRAIFLTIIVLSVFFLCFGPTNTIFLMHYLHFLNGHSESLYFAYILCACISSVSSCLDPLMYYYASAKCRKYVYSLLGCKKTDKQQTKHPFCAPKESSTECSFVK
ncbi:proteinase-activated receptor 1-like [Hyla sarda]|uniref:proteinase-activated receptor 1-like n=1 Tax=Hyla sarda TaxID=327740 RepID=UPI0024C25AC3|nr:proteinase-activated receptor 1-like [Hyla sarda]